MSEVPLYQDGGLVVGAIREARKEGYPTQKKLPFPRTLQQAYT